MGKRKNRIGRIHKNCEKKRQENGMNPPGRPRTRTPRSKPHSTPTTAVSVSLQDFSEIALPSSAWSLQSSSHNRLIIIKVKEQSTSTQPLVISHSIVLQSDLSWQLSVNGHEIEAAKFASLSRFPARMSTPSTLSQLLSRLDRLTVCSGHPDAHFVSMAKAKKGKFVSSHGELTAFLDTHTGPDTVRTATCQMLTSSTKCPQCATFRPTLRAMYHRWSKTNTRELPHSHTNERWLNTPQRSSKTRHLKKRVKKAEKQIKRIKNKIAASTETRGVHLDESFHADLIRIMDNQRSSIESEYEENSFHRLFWKQQLEATAKHPTQRRWHPMLIRWCPHLRMLSSSAYDSLRGILQLPCGRTLQDYTHYIKAGVGIQSEVTAQLMKEAKIDGCEEYQKYVGVVFDEMKIKEGIVYDKHECIIKGFVDLGQVNNTLLSFEQSIHTTPQVAKEMLVFMVRGIFTKLTFPYAQYPTRGITADCLFPIAWEVVKNLECAGFKVISLTGDKASANRKFFAMHNLTQSQHSKETHKIRNPYSIEERDIFFLSDAPHLIKTVRNCWSNSFGHSHKRALWINGSHISWEHIKRLYQRRTPSGLSLLPKITFEHVNLNSYSRMRVNLAAQVLSKSVADALEYYNDPDTTETRRFVQYFDRFFDMMNTRHLDEGIQKRKPDLAPFRRDDPRFTWLERDFLGYLDEWHASVQSRSGFTLAERKKMELSDETLSGLKLTVRSFVEMGKYLLQQPGVQFLLSERFCQDPLEAFFGHQRSKGGRSDNPTSKQFCDTTVSLRVQKSAAVDPLRGNCRKRPSSSTIAVDEEPLPKRKRH